MTVLLENVLVPKALLRHPGRFGGAEAQDCLTGDLVLAENGVRLRMATHPAPPTRMVLPRLTECHVHLDKCHTLHRMAGIGGDLRAAIDAQARDRDRWTAEDIRARASRGLAELIAAGCGAVRSHLDWTSGAQATTPPLAWSVLQELAQDNRATATLQLAALTSVEDLADPATADAIARILAKGGGVLGVFVLGHPERQAGIANAFRAAAEHGLALDFHVDEGLEPGLDGLELIADTASAQRFEGPVLCGHACALMNHAPDDVARIADKLVRAGISVAALPGANLYLQGRGNGTPDRRGVTRLRELRAAGVNVTVGTDNVRDAFCPLGRHDPRASLALAALAAHLDPPYGDHLPLITTNARSAMGLPPLHIDAADPSELLVFNAASTADLLTGTTAPTP
jgi:cytosine deaminase